MFAYRRTLHKESKIDVKKKGKLACRAIENLINTI